MFPGEQNALDPEKLLQKKAVPYKKKVYPHHGHSFDGDALADANQHS